MLDSFKLYKVMKNYSSHPYVVSKELNNKPITRYGRRLKR